MILILANICVAPNTLIIVLLPCTRVIPLCSYAYDAALYLRAMLVWIKSNLFSDTFLPPDIIYLCVSALLWLPCYFYVRYIIWLLLSRCQPRWLSGLMRSRVHSLWLLVDHCVLRNWDRILVRAVKGLISRAGIVSICPLLWQRDVKLQQTLLSRHHQ